MLTYYQIEAEQVDLVLGRGRRPRGVPVSNAAFDPNYDPRKDRTEG